MITIAGQGAERIHNIRVTKPAADEMPKDE